MSKPWAMKPTPAMTFGARPMRRQKPAVLAIERVVILAGLGDPGADAVLGAAQLD